MNFRFDQPVLLSLLLLAGPIVWLGMRSLAAIEPVRRWTAVGLRLAVLLLLVLMLAGMQGVRRHTDLTVMVVRDVSESVRRFAKPPNPSADSIDQWIDRWIDAAVRKSKRQTDRLGVLTYDQRAVVRVLPSETGDAGFAASADAREGTDSAAALRQGMTAIPADTTGRLLLISDGNDTSGDLLAAAREAAAAGIAVDVLPIGYALDNEVMVDVVHAPADLRKGQTAAIRVVLRATKPSAGLLRLKHDDVEVGGSLRIDESDWTRESDDHSAAGARYITVRQLDLPLDYGGIHDYEATFETDSAADTITVNNRAGSLTMVSDPGRVLVVSDLPPPSDTILPRALESRDIQVDAIAPSAFPVRLGELQRYDAVIFQNVEQADITAPQQRMLSKYVSDMGGGFVMIGGPHSFAPGAWAHTPIDELLPVQCQLPQQVRLPSGALVIVIDRTGSMGMPVGGTGKSQIMLAAEAAKLALDTLYPQDLVGVIAMDLQPQWIVKLQPNTDPGTTIRLMRSLEPSGDGNISLSLSLAYDAFANQTYQDAAVRHCILLTDGYEPANNYPQLLARFQQADITVTTVGVGDGQNAGLLADIAARGGGSFHSIRNPAMLPQVFIKEAKVLRKNQIKEETFTPTLHAVGSPIIANLDTPPPLRGFVLTAQKDDPRVFLAMTGPEDEPVFAHWQVGLGRAAAFTSDAHNQWAVDWLNWTGYADFWARTVRYIARPSSLRNGDLLVTLDGDNLHLRIDTTTDDDVAQIVGSVLQPDGEVASVTFEQTAPGLYEATVSAPTTGNYAATAFIQGPDGHSEAVFGAVARPPGEELRRFRSNLALLQSVADITGGRMLDPAAPVNADLFSRADRDYVTRAVRPLWRQLLTVLLVLVLLDVACRRIAWDAAAIAAWVRQRIHLLFGSRQVQAEPTLAALRNRQSQVRTSTTRATSGVEDVPYAIQQRNKRKFEAAPDFVAQSNVSQAVNGAGASTPTEVAPQSEEENPPPESTTGHLLQAKRRARSQRNNPG